MDSRKPLYRHSLKEAVRHEEKDLWRESYKINCDCAMAIERIIAENYDGKKLGRIWRSRSSSSMASTV